MNDYLLERKSSVFKALAHPVRLAIAERLIKGERCVCEIAADFPFDRTTISKHLAVLRSAGVIRDRKEGLNVYYSLSLRCLGRLLSCLDDSIRNELLSAVRALKEPGPDTSQE
jgi:ArsR family transcriptional regulator